MTATIRTPEPKHARHAKRKKRRTRFSSMESLGFIEDPATVSNTWTTAPPAAPVPAPAQAPKVKRGAHERTVADMEPNDTTEYLTRRNFRWGPVVVTTLLVGALITGGVWLLQRPAAVAEAAVAEVATAASALEQELAGLAEANSMLVEAEIDRAAVTSRAGSADNRARILFNAAGALPDTAGETRTNAVDAATAALNASRMIADAAAYRSAVVGILVAPALETDPELVALDEAVRSFGEWQLNFDQVRSALPTGTMSRVTDALQVVSGNLEGIQGRYVDALREDDATAAATALSELATQLGAAEDLLWSSLAEVRSRAAELIEESSASLTAIPR